MKHFAILRDVDPQLSWEQMDAAAIQNLVWMHIITDGKSFEVAPNGPEVHWVRTYWELGSNWATCLYAAEDRNTVREWHDTCQVAYAGITEIEVEEADEAGAYPRGFHAAGEDAPLIAIEGPGEVLAKRRLDGLRWIRTYRDPSSGTELQLFLPQARVMSLNRDPIVTVHRVVELRPSDYEGDEP